MILSRASWHDTADIRNFALQNVWFCEILVRKFRIYLILHVKLPTGASWEHRVMVLVMVTGEAREGRGAFFVVRFARFVRFVKVRF